MGRDERADYCGHGSKQKNDQDDEDDPFASVWRSSRVSDEPMPFDSTGHLGIAFYLAEIVGRLKDTNAPQSDIDKVNAAFRRLPPRRRTKRPR